MKKIISTCWQRIKSLWGIFKEKALSITFVFTLLVLTLLISSYLYFLKNESSIQFLGIVITYALLSITYQQYKIQKNKIKLEMFDKRLAVYEALRNSLNLIQQSDKKIAQYLLSRGGLDSDYNKCFYDARDNLNVKSIESRFLFDSELMDKVEKITIKFNEVIDLYFEGIVAMLQFSERQKVELNLALAEYMRTSDSEKYLLDIEQLDKKYFEINNNFLLKCAEYKTFLENAHIFDDMEKYMTLHNLDQ